MPRCRCCGHRMNYYIPGMADADHAHPECADRSARDDFLEPLTWRRRARPEPDCC